MPNSIKRISKIKIYYHTFVFSPDTWVQGLLYKDDVVHYVSTFNKPPLIFWDDYRENFFNSAGYNFCEDFVACIAKGDWPEPVKTDCSFFFRISARKDEFVPPPNLLQV